ncbi:MAG: sensor histidine kinase [Planctomycetota bacterium]
MNRSTIYAAVLALSYAVVATTYIVVSSDVAAALATDVANMQAIETVKGVVFVAVTTLFTWVGARAAMRRIERDADELARRERALVASEGKVFAGVIAATVAHDANNVLTALLGHIELLHFGDPDDRETIQELQRSVKRLVGLNKRLLVAAREAGPGEGQELDLVATVQEGVRSMRSHEQLRGCRFEFVVEAPGPVAVTAQPLLLDQIVGNLVLNAGQATGGSGAVRVVITAEGDTAAVEVHDDGPGVPPERRADLFRRLQSTRPDGAGLGLFSAHACAQSLGGALSVGDSPLGGACFRVRLPLARVAVGVSVG